MKRLQLTAATLMMILLSSTSALAGNIGTRTETSLFGNIGATLFGNIGTFIAGIM